MPFDLQEQDMEQLISDYGVGSVLGALGCVRKAYQRNGNSFDISPKEFLYAIKMISRRRITPRTLKSFGIIGEDGSSYQKPQRWYSTPINPKKQQCNDPQDRLEEGLEIIGNHSQESIQAALEEYQNIKPFINQGVEKYHLPAFYELLQIASYNPKKAVEISKEIIEIFGRKTLDVLKEKSLEAAVLEEKEPYTDALDVAMKNPLDRGVVNNLLYAGYRRGPFGKAMNPHNTT